MGIIWKGTTKIKRYGKRKMQRLRGTGIGILWIDFTFVNRMEKAA